MPTETDSFERLKSSDRRIDITEVTYDLIRKQGILGLVLVAMMYFIWNGEKNKRADTASLMSVIDRNTEAFTKNAVLWSRVEARLERLEP
jgi:hypothetical protein